MLMTGVSEERLLLTTVEFSERRVVLSLLSELGFVCVCLHGSTHGSMYSSSTVHVPIFCLLMCSVVCIM